MSHAIGIFLSFLCVHFALVFLNQNFAMYFDDVALAIVVGCTFAVSIIVLPWGQSELIFSRLRKLFFRRSINQSQLLRDCINFVGSVKQGGYTPVKSKEMCHEVLNEGQELIELHFSVDEIEAVLQERVHQASERIASVASAFSSLAKYPPAFGLIGTVFGLVNLMRAISDGLDPTQTGIKMAIALVATLYGLVVANLIIAPIAEQINKQASEERHLADIALQAVLLAAQDVSLLKAQEMLNSFVTPNKRVNFIGKWMESGSAA